MEARVRMMIVDNLFADISERIGRLTNQGVFTLEEGVKIINLISDKESEWMKNNFSEAEVDAFMRESSI